MKKNYRYILIYVIALLLRLIFSLAVDYNSLFKSQFEPVALNLLKGNGFTLQNHPFILYPPAYSIFIALLYKIFWRSEFLVTIVQILITSFTPVIMAKIHYTIWQHEKSAMLCGFLAAIMPITAVHDSFLIAGAFGSFSLVLSVLLLSKPRHKYGHLSFFLAGIFIGLGAQFRSEIAGLIFWIPLVVLLTALSGKITKATLLITGALVVMAPWTIRNYMVFGKVSLTSPGLGVATSSVIGKMDNQSGLPYGDGEVCKAEGYTEIMWPYPYERDRARLQNTINYTLTRPWKYFCIVLTNTPLAWFGHSMHLSMTGAGFQKCVLTSDNKTAAAITFARRHPMAVTDRILGTIIAFVVFVSGILGIITTKNKDYRVWVIIGIVAYYFAVTSFIGVIARYSIPAYIFLILFSTNLLQNPTPQNIKPKTFGE